MRQRVGQIAMHRYVSRAAVQGCYIDCFDPPRKSCVPTARNMHQFYTVEGADRGNEVAMLVRCDEYLYRAEVGPSRIGSII